MDNNNLAIIKALVYFDIFAYPLTQSEIEKYQSGELSKTQIQKSLQTTLIERVDDYFFLKGRKKLVRIRKQREKISHLKLQRASKIAHILRYIPTILYVGVSGSLAMNHAKKNDDIDLFIITSSNTLWLSRSIVILILFLTKNLRRYESTHTQDSFCINMWLDASHLLFPEKRRNLYTAHEIVQLRALYDKNNTYQQFVSTNSWIKTFLPNALVGKSVSRKVYTKEKNNFLLNPIETVAKKIQLWYMKRHITTETITDGFVAFHPQDYTKMITYKLQKGFEKYDIQ